MNAIDYSVSDVSDPPAVHSYLCFSLKEKKTTTHKVLERKLQFSSLLFIFVRKKNTTHT